MAHVLDRTGRGGVKLHHAAQNSLQFNTSELLFSEFPSNIFRLWLTVGNKLRQQNHEQESMNHCTLFCDWLLSIMFAEFTMWRPMSELIPFSG